MRLPPSSEESSSRASPHWYERRPDRPLSGRSGGHGKIGSRRSAGSCDHPIGRMRLLRSVTTIDRMLQLNFFAVSDAGT